MKKIGDKASKMKDNATFEKNTTTIHRNTFKHFFSDFLHCLLKSWRLFNQNQHKILKVSGQ